MTTDVEINAHNLEVTNRIKEYITKKASKLDRYFNEIEEIKVDLSYIKSARSASDRQVAQITVRARKALLRTEERSGDLFAAFDTAYDKMHRQLERYKGRHHRGRGDGRTAAEVVEAKAGKSPRATPSLIVRRKAFKLLPMDEAIALEQMRMLGHENFFIFFNVETNAINVLYQRRDGTFGLIEPQID